MKKNAWLRNGYWNISDSTLKRICQEMRYQRCFLTIRTISISLSSGKRAGLWASISAIPRSNTQKRFCRRMFVLWQSFPWDLGTMITAISTKHFYWRPDLIPQNIYQSKGDGCIYFGCTWNRTQQRKAIFVTIISIGTDISVPISLIGISWFAQVKEI